MNFDSTNHKALIYLQDLLGVRQGFQEGAIQRKVISWSQHPKYVSGRAYYDAAVAVADQLIEYTEYVRPVCLPMTPVDDDDAFADDLVTLAGKIIEISWISKPKGISGYNFYP